VQGQAKAATELQTKLQAAQAEQQQQARAVADADLKRKAAEAEQQRLKEEVQRQTKAATDADAKLKAALTEQQRLAKAATDADAKRGAAEAELQRLKDEVQRQTKAAADADSKRRAAEAELAAVRAAARSAAVPQAASTPGVRDSSAPSSGLFRITTGQEATGDYYKWVYAAGGTASSMDACEQNCAQTATCDIFSLNKATNMCFLYSRADFKGLRRHTDYNSGIRASACQLTVQSSQLSQACSE